MPPEIKVNSGKISEALKEMDEQQIWAFLDHFEEETLARAKMLSDLGYGGGGVDDVRPAARNIRGRTGSESWSPIPRPTRPNRSAEHTSELQSLMRITYAVFCFKKKPITTAPNTY